MGRRYKDRAKIVSFRDDVIELGLQGATDEAILAGAHHDRSVVITRDSDFRMLLALARATEPSAVGSCAENLSHAGISHLIDQVIQAVGSSGVVASATRDQIRFMTCR